jgi:AraC-like DNA-binding protein
MEFPLDILKLRLAASPRNSATSESNLSSPRIPLGLTHDFIGALKLVLRSYLPDYYPSLDVAAAIAGVGARTLQRRLAQFGLTYSKLVEQIRLETAIDLLRDPSRRIIDIAYKVGYGDPSHFTRAFRRALGASPKAFRQSLASRKFCEVYRIPYKEVGSGVAHTENVPIGNSANDMVGLPDLAIAKMQERFDFPETPTRKSN